MIWNIYCNTHRVQAKSSRKSGAHDKRLACLGVEEYTGRKYDELAERSAGKVPLSKGAN